MANTSPKYRIRPIAEGSLIDHLLFHRGVKTLEEKDAFLNPDYNKGIHDPFLMKDMDKVVSRIIDAINKKEKICIYTDYDADGIPAGVVFHDFFKKISYENVMFYIPHRHKEGFGLNSDAVEKIAKQGAKLLITADCGIADVDEVAHANSLGMEVVVTDHHLPHDVLPAAFAILDPQQPGCNYPEKILCGSGVVYKLIQGLYQKLGLKEGMEKWSLDMVGLATLSDMVPLVGENRILASYGLRVMRKTPRVGLCELFKSLKLDQKTLAEDDVQFLVTPRINAASRMADPVLAFELLSTDDIQKAKGLCKVLTDINTDRKVQVALISKEIKKNHSDADFQAVPLIVVGNPNWKPALLGLVANSLMRDYQKPAFVWGRDEEGIIKGSCRSNGSYHLVDLMSAVEPGVFHEAGGHAMSGGFAVSNDHIHLISDHLIKALDKVSISEIDSAIDVDSLISLSDINWKFWEALDKMAPFGEKNAKPLFMFQKITVVGYKKFGKAGEHVEVRIGNSDGAVLPAISFFNAENPTYQLSQSDVIDMVATIEKSNFKGRPELRLRIVDIIKSK
ncbi:MAG: single-stranded-DNA-specific exonuclease RecJ [bacterium]